MGTTGMKRKCEKYGALIVLSIDKNYLEYCLWCFTHLEQKSINYSSQNILSRKFFYVSFRSKMTPNQILGIIQPYWFLYNRTVIYRVRLIPRTGVESFLDWDYQLSLSAKHYFSFVNAKLTKSIGLYWRISKENFLPNQ